MQKNCKVHKPEIKLSQKIMRFIYCFFLFTSLIFFKPVNAQNYCPVNFTAELLSVMREVPSAYYGKILACEGQILRVEKGYKDQPYFELRLKSSEQTIWVSGQVESGYEKVGTLVKVLGFFEKAAAGYKPEKVHKDVYHLVGVAILDVVVGQMYMQSGQEGIVQQWLNGQIPVAVKKRGQKD
jgi:hypothetical protein